MVTVCSFKDEMKAHLAKSVLEQAGIDAFIRKDDCGGWGGADMWLVEGLHVVVSSEDAAAAQQALESLSES